MPINPTSIDVLAIISLLSYFLPGSMCLLRDMMVCHAGWRDARLPPGARVCITMADCWLLAPDIGWNLPALNI